MIGTAEEMRAAREAQQREDLEWTRAWFEMHRQRLIYGTAVAEVWPEHNVGDLRILVWQDADGSHTRVLPRFAWLRRELSRAIERPRNTR